MKENKTKVLLLIIALLLIANVVLLVLFFQKAPAGLHSRQDRKTYIAAFLKKDIGFTDEQLAKFDTLSDNHKQRVSAIFDKEGVNKDEQFKQLLAGGFSDSAMTSLAEKTANTQKATNAMMFNHIKNIRLLCSKEQLPAFDSLFGKVLNKRGGAERK